MEIWKLQRPLHSTEEMPMVLAYTEENHDGHLVPMIEEDMFMLFGDAQKIYVEGYLGDDTILHILRIVKEEQDW